MARCSILLVWSLSAAALSSGAQNDPTAAKDLKMMQGTWKVAQVIEKGQRLAAKDVTPVSVVIAADKMTISDAGKFREEITLTLDTSQGIKAVDLVYTKGPNTGKKERGIYTFESNMLLYCVNESPNGARPKAFASTPANGCSVAVLQRAEK